MGYDIEGSFFIGYNIVLSRILNKINLIVGLSYNSLSVVLLNRINPNLSSIRYVNHARLCFVQLNPF